jgi:hypothetical protein
MSNADITKPENTCDNVVSQVIDSLLNLYLGMNEANPYIASVVVMALISLPFYLIYSIKNNAIAAKTAMKIFGNNGGA